MKNPICYCDKCKPIHDWVGREVPSGTCKVCGEIHGVDGVINYCPQCLDTVIKTRDEGKFIQIGDNKPFIECKIKKVTNVDENDNISFSYREGRGGFLSSHGVGKPIGFIYYDDRYFHTTKILKEEREGNIITITTNNRVYELEVIGNV